MNQKNIESFKSFIKKKENRKYLILILLVVFLIFYLGAFASPKITLKAQIHDVTDNDFKMFVDNKFDVPKEKRTRENCRYITIKVKIAKPILLVRNLKVDNLSLKEYLYSRQYSDNTSNDILSLGTFSMSDSNEFAEGTDVYMDGMTDEKLKNFFGDHKITVTWRDLLNRKQKQIFYLKDYFY